MSDPDTLIGSKITLSYYDHNESFAECLPQSGKIVSQHETGDVNDWFLLSLDNPIKYAGNEVQDLLIRSKWQGQSISSKEKTGVFVLLVPERKNIPRIIPDIDAFEHVAWGFAIVVDT